MSGLKLGTDQVRFLVRNKCTLLQKYNCVIQTWTLHVNMSTLDSNFQEGKYYDSDTESDSSSDEVEEDSPGTTTKVINERAPLWNGRELQALVLLKDRWVSADSEGRDKVLKEAMDKLVELEPRPDVKKLKDKLKYWFRRKARRRQDYGVGHKPSFKTMVGYYCEGEIWDQLRKEYPVGEGEKFKVEIGKWNAMAARVQKDIRTNPLRKKDKDMLEKKREEWVTKGMPKEQRRKWVSIRIGVYFADKF
jgi:hypothetical protein